MKILVENHKENDKTLIENLKKAEEKRHLETHTTTCEKCGAKLHFYERNLKFNFEYTRPEILHGATVTCPCCNHSTKIPMNIAGEDYKAYRERMSKKSAFDTSHKEDRIPEVEVLKEGNFQIEMTCNNCESSFSFDYRDTFEKEVTREIRDYMWNTYYTTSKEPFVRCPICGKEHEVNTRS